MSCVIAIETKSKGTAQKFTDGIVQQFPTDESKAALWIEKSIVYMVQHLDRPLQVATLVARADISPSSFFALFKRRIGSSPMDYFTRLRMQRARRMLEGTSLSIKAIAFELGYRDSLYFSRVFKSINQIAPSDYRAAQKERAGRAGGRRKESHFSENSVRKHLRRAQFA